MDLESKNIERLTGSDFDLTNDVLDALQDFTEKYRSYYITVFLNKDNRKLCVKYVYGDLKSAVINKIDEGAE